MLRRAIVGLAAAVALMAVCAPMCHAGFSVTYTQDFSDPGNTDWFSYQSPINASGGVLHVTPPAPGDFSGAFTRFDGYRSDWNGNWSASMDVFLDPAAFKTTYDAMSGSLAPNTTVGFEYSVAATRQNGDHLRDFITHFGYDPTSASDPTIMVMGSNNSDFRANLWKFDNSSNVGEITDAGWYTLEQNFFEEVDGSLAVELAVLDPNGNKIFSEIRNNPSDLIASLVGGNRYGWITFSDLDDLQLDNVTLTTPFVPEPATMALWGAISLAGAGFLRRRKK